MRGLELGQLGLRLKLREMTIRHALDSTCKFRAQVWGIAQKWVTSGYDGRRQL